MKPRFPFIAEFPGEPSSSSSSSRHFPAAEYVAAPLPPRPMEAAPFLIKAFEMVDDLNTSHIISWNKEGQSFVVWDPHAFSNSVLPRYFRHNNFSSFIRQLNSYGFKKIDAEKWEFANEAFIRGQKHLLTNMRRRKSPSQSPPQQQPVAGPCVELGEFGHEEEVDQLRRDKKVLTMELVKLRQEQQSNMLHLQHIETRLCETERKKQLMMKFLARAMQNPDFTHKLFRRKMKLKDDSSKWARFIQAGETSQSDEVLNQVKTDQVSELEALALEMQGLGKAKREPDEIERLEGGERGLGEFWDELVNQGFDEATKNEDEDKDENKNVNVLADMFGFWGSSSK